MKESSRQTINLERKTTAYIDIGEEELGELNMKSLDTSPNFQEQITNKMKFVMPKKVEKVSTFKVID